MSVNVIQAPRASAPFPWRKFYAWMSAQGLSPEEVQEMIENGVEPEVRWGEGLTLDQSVTYPGLPALENSPTLQPEFDPEPNSRFIGGRPL